jgi:hypothetical protein
MELELRRDRAHLSFEREHLVNSKSIQMDMLIIKKEKELSCLYLQGKRTSCKRDFHGRYNAYLSAEQTTEKAVKRIVRKGIYDYRTIRWNILYPEGYIPYDSDYRHGGTGLGRTRMAAGTYGPTEGRGRRASDEEEKITICTGKKAKHWD